MGEGSSQSPSIFHLGLREIQRGGTQGEYCFAGDRQTNQGWFRARLDKESGRWTQTHSRRLTTQ